MIITPLIYAEREPFTWKEMGIKKEKETTISRTMESRLWVRNFHSSRKDDMTMRFFPFYSRRGEIFLARGYDEIENGDRKRSKQRNY